MYMYFCIAFTYNVSSCVISSLLPFLTELARKEESARLLEDKVRRTETEARELEAEKAACGGGEEGARRCGQEG